MNFQDVLRLFTRRLPSPWAADDARLRDAEERISTIMAQQARRANERDEHARMEALGVNRQILEERIESEIQKRRRARGGGDHAGTS